MKKVLLFLCILIVACQEEGIRQESNSTQLSKQFDQKVLKNVEIKFTQGQQGLRIRKTEKEPILDLMIQINNVLSGQGVMLEKIEMLGAEEVGRTVFFNNVGNKQLSSDFVPNDPSNLGGTDVPYWIDGTQLGTSSGMSELETFDAIVSTMNTWDAVTCSEGLNIPFWGSTGIDVGLVQYFTGYGGSSLYAPGTILHAGILPPTFFEDVLGPGAGDGTIGVTFTFIWTDDNTNEPLDIDNNGKNDVAIKEIYINDNFNFQDAPNDGLFNGITDFETVVLHEVGHGLSQGHFGTAFLDGANRKLHFSPAALMNAGYTVGRRAITMSDEAGHCSNWGSWPNN